MNPFEQLAAEMQQLAPFRIRYKASSWEMKALNVIMQWISPTFLTRFTTVIGSTIYFPSEEYVVRHPRAAMRILAHEMVHMLDAERVSLPLFIGGYLFPQVLALGALAYPWLGTAALWFLLFLLPWPAPFRSHFEARAYAMDILTAAPARRSEVLNWAVDYFSSWSYFRMFPFPNRVRRQICRHIDNAEAGHDTTLLKVLLVYELVAENS
ncbi:MAG: hypothetical protein OHK0039_27450 [Bacteroidia bacterium]